MRDIGASWFEMALTRLLTMRSYGVFGRTMAQPIRNSGCRPVTNHSNARGTSGTRPGNRLRDIGRRGADRVGGAPDHDAAGLVEFRKRHPRRSFRRPVEKQMGTRRVERDQGRKLRVAGHRLQRVVGSPLKTVAEEIRDRPRRQRGRHLAAAGPGHEKRGRRTPRARARRRRPPRPSATDAGAGDGRDRRWRRSRRAPTSAERRRSRRRRDRNRTGRKAGSRTAPAPIARQ